MDIRIRKLIFLFYIVLFFITAPAVVLYTAGYRYNLKKQNIEQLGAFVFVTEPEDLLVEVNDKQFEKNEDVLIEDFLPDTHNIRISKEGYYNWEKKLEIKPNLTTFVTKVKLFKQHLPALVYNEQVKDIFYSESSQNAIIKTEKDLQFISFPSLEKKQILEIPKGYSIEELNWSPNEEKVLLSFLNPDEEKIYIIIDLNKPSNKVYLPGKGITLYRWSSNDNNRLYSIKEGKVVVTSLVPFKESVITGQTTLSSFNLFPFQEDIFTISYDEGNKDLFLAHIKDGVTEPVIALNEKNEYHFSSLTGDYFSLRASSDQKLYIFNKDNLQNPKIFKEKEACKYQSSEEIFICWNNFEISVLNDDFTEEFLISRFSKGIETVLVHNEFPYVFAQIDNQIKAIEIDLKNQQNIINLIELPLINHLGIGPNKDKLFFYGELGNQKGFHELSLE